jgi:hypothetical protein
VWRVGYRDEFRHEKFVFLTLRDSATTTIAEIDPLIGEDIAERLDKIIRRGTIWSVAVSIPTRALLTISNPDIATDRFAPLSTIYRNFDEKGIIFEVVTTRNCTSNPQPDCPMGATIRQGCLKTCRQYLATPWKTPGYRGWLHIWIKARYIFPAVVTVGEKSRFILFLADTGAPTSFIPHEVSTITLLYSLLRLDSGISFDCRHWGHTGLPSHRKSRKV